MRENQGYKGRGAFRAPPRPFGRALVAPRAPTGAGGFRPPWARPPGRAPSVAPRSVVRETPPRPKGALGGGAWVGWLPGRRRGPYGGPGRRPGGTLWGALLAAGLPRRRAMRGRGAPREPSPGRGIGRTSRDPPPGGPAARPREGDGGPGSGARRGFSGCDVRYGASWAFLPGRGRARGRWGGHGAPAAARARVGPGGRIGDAHILEAVSMMGWRARRGANALNHPPGEYGRKAETQKNRRGEMNAAEPGHCNAMTRAKPYRCMYGCPAPASSGAGSTPLNRWAAQVLHGRRQFVACELWGSVLMNERNLPRGLHPPTFHCAWRHTRFKTRVPDGCAP